MRECLDELVRGSTTGDIAGQNQLRQPFRIDGVSVDLPCAVDFSAYEVLHHTTSPGFMTYTTSKNPEVDCQIGIPAARVTDMDIRNLNEMYHHKLEYR